MLDISRQAVSKWESDNTYPETEKLILLSKKLGVSIDYLLNNKSNALEEENRPVIYVPSGKIAITNFDKTGIVNCEPVKPSQIIGNGKVPKYVLYDIEGTNFWGEKTQISGWYKTIDEIQEEIRKINQAIQEGKSSYEL